MSFNLYEEVQVRSELSQKNKLETDQNDLPPFVESDQNIDNPHWQLPSKIFKCSDQMTKKNQTEAFMFSSDINDYNTLSLTKTAEAYEKLALGNASYIIKSLILF